MQNEFHKRRVTLHLDFKCAFQELSDEGRCVLKSDQLRFFTYGKNRAEVEETLNEAVMAIVERFDSLEELEKHLNFLGVSYQIEPVEDSERMEARRSEVVASQPQERYLESEAYRRVKVAFAAA